MGTNATSPPGGLVPPRAPTRSGKRILIVDDEPDSRDALRTLLEVWGHEVDVAESGEQAIQLTLSRRPDVVLLDISMPRMNGYEVARRIRQAPGGQEPYLVALTGWGRVEDGHLADAAGFDEYMLKPADPDRLQAVLAADHAQSRDPGTQAR